MSVYTGDPQTWNQLLIYIEHNWLWIVFWCWIFSSAIGSFFGSVRDFFLSFFVGLAEIVMGTRHRHRMQELRLQAKIEKQRAKGPGPQIRPGIGPCAHLRPKAVINTLTDQREAWYCPDCDSQLPANWAITTGELHELNDGTEA